MKEHEIQLHWIRAIKALKSAWSLLSLEYYEDSVSRAYYAVLHSARAALLLQNVVPTSHTALRNLFGKYLVKTGEMEKEWATILSQEYTFRTGADYVEHFEISNETAKDLVQDAERFVLRIQKYLQSKGIVLETQYLTKSD